MPMADDESPFELGKILIRDLAPNTSQDCLKGYFAQYGDVNDAVIPPNRDTGDPLSFGFVIFKHPLTVPVILQLPHCIRDQSVEVSRALKGEDLQTLESQRMTTNSAGDDNLEGPVDFDRRSIFVQGLPRSGLTMNDFLKYFQGFGNVINCCFWDDIGFGQITFRIERNVDRVLYRRFHILNGKRWRVNRLRCMNDPHNDVCSCAKNIQQEPAASDTTNNEMQAEASSSDGSVNGTRDIQTQANQTSVTEPESNGLMQDAKISETDSVNGTRDIQLQGDQMSVMETTINRQMEDVAVSVTDYVNSNRDIEPKVDQIRNTEPKRTGEMQDAIVFGSFYVDGTIDIQQKAATSVIEPTRSEQMQNAEASSTDNVNGTSNIQPQDATSVTSPTRNAQMQSAATSGTDHINDTANIQPQAATEHNKNRGGGQMQGAENFGTNYICDTGYFPPQPSRNVRWDNTNRGDLCYRYSRMQALARCSIDYHPQNNSTGYPRRGNDSNAVDFNAPIFIPPSIEYFNFPIPNHDPSIYRPYYQTGFFIRPVYNFPLARRPNFPTYYDGYGHSPWASNVAFQYLGSRSHSL